MGDRFGQVEGDPALAVITVGHFEQFDEQDGARSAGRRPRLKREALHRPDERAWMSVAIGFVFVRNLGVRCEMTVQPRRIVMIVVLRRGSGPMHMPVRRQKRREQDGQDRHPARPPVLHGESIVDGRLDACQANRPRSL